MTGQRHTSEFLHPVGVDLLEWEDMDVLFREAWQARYEEIESDAMA